MGWYFVYDWFYLFPDDDWRDDAADKVWWLENPYRYEDYELG
jgi:hypothetical protein